jgi:DNA invertase Pin-like site-specific DNA recombinase
VPFCKYYLLDLRFLGRTRGAKFGRKPKLTRQQINHARRLIDDGQRREDVAALLNVGRATLYRGLAA